MKETFQHERVLTSSDQQPSQTDDDLIYQAGDEQISQYWNEDWGNASIASPFAGGLGSAGLGGSAAANAKASAVTSTPTGFTIIPVWDSSITTSADEALVEGAIETAIRYFEQKITTKETITIDFGYGIMPYDGSSTGQGGAESVGNTVAFTWTQVYDAAEAIENSATASATQKAAAALLKTDNAKYAAALNSGMIDVTMSEALALGLPTTGFTGSYAGWVGLGSGKWDWAQNSTADEDAVSAMEHEISEVMGRVDNLGVPNGNAAEYSLLDLFHYASASGTTVGGAAPGSAAGALDEPFVAGYDDNLVSYFSYNGSTITWQYDTPSEVSGNGEDVADWSTTNTNRPAATNSFDGEGGNAIDPPISSPDWQELNVLGYSERPAVIPVDFNNDGYADVLFRNPTSGADMMWESNGAGGYNTVNLSTAGTPWSVAGVGDFTDNGLSDILWRNSSNGDVDVWDSNGKGGFVGHALASVSTSFQIVGIGDFNGDGFADVLFRNPTSGADMMWESNGAGGYTTVNLSTVSTPWSVAGVGDFTDNGLSDILWRNSSNGDVAVWDSNGKGGFVGHALASVSTSFQIAGIGDFNGDGFADVLFRNPTSGADMMWESNGAGGYTTVNLSTVSTAWSVAGIGDFTGNGLSDILWRNSSSGAIDVWDSNGKGGFAGHSLATVSTSLQIVAA